MLLELAIHAIPSYALWYPGAGSLRPLPDVQRMPSPGTVRWAPGLHAERQAGLHGPWLPEVNTTGGFLTKCIPINEKALRGLCEL